MNRSRCHRPVADPEARLKHCGRGWAADRVLPMVLPSGPTGTYSDGLSRTVRAGQRPRRTPPDTVGRICKAEGESSILYVSTGTDLRFLQARSESTCRISVDPDRGAAGFAEIACPVDPAARLGNALPPNQSKNLQPGRRVPAVGIHVGQEVAQAIETTAGLRTTAGFGSVWMDELGVTDGSGLKAGAHRFVTATLALRPDNVASMNAATSFRPKLQETGFPHRSPPHSDDNYKHMVQQ